jgi:cytochrome c553
MDFLFHLIENYHDTGRPFGKNLMQHLIEEEIQEIEAHTAAQVMNMDSSDNVL